MSDTVRVMGIDPGADSGHSIHVVSNGRPRLERHGGCRGDDPAAIAEVCAHAQRVGCKLAVIEDQFFDVKKWNPDSVKKLVRSSGRWEQACVDHGMEVVWVPPSTWQNDMLGHARMTSKVLKTMSKARVKCMYDLEVSADVSDAILIGRREADKIALKQRQQGRRGAP